MAQASEHEQGEEGITWRTVGAGSPSQGWVRKVSTHSRGSSRDG